MCCCPSTLSLIYEVNVIQKISTIRYFERGEDEETDTFVYLKLINKADTNISNTQHAMKFN